MIKLNATVAILALLLAMWCADQQMIGQTILAWLLVLFCTRRWAVLHRREIHSNERN
jgi:hypothetical protein